MKRTVVCIAVLSWLVIALSLRTQTVDTTVCDILSNPQSFDGEIVRVKGVAIAGFEEFAIQGTGCDQLLNAIWLAYPEGARGKAGPVASLRLQLGKNNPAVVSTVIGTPVTLDKNKDFKEFDKLLSTQVKTDGMCLGCVKFTVAGTFVGRLDGTKDAGLSRDGSGKVVGLNGFGNLNRYS